LLAEAYPTILWVVMPASSRIRQAVQEECHDVILLSLLGAGDKDTTTFRNVENHSPNGTGTCPKRLEYLREKCMFSKLFMCHYYCINTKYAFCNRSNSVHRIKT
jgi:hypothetical protein